MQAIPVYFKNWPVLVVEDNPAGLEVASRLLSLAGATVYQATSGAEALRIARRRELRFILTDLRMPGMTGWDLLKHLQAQPHTADIPVIALSGDDCPKAIERALAAGFRGYVTKPLHPATFIAELARQLHTDDDCPCSV